MFDVLVYLYENYWRPDACPEPQQLRRKLSAVGFEADEIQDALRWLDGLAVNAQASVGLLVDDESGHGDTDVSADEAATEATSAPPAALPDPHTAAPSGKSGATPSTPGGAASTAVAAEEAPGPPALLPASTSLRVYTDAEQDVLSAECLGFISFLESAGVLPLAMREMVVDRAMAVGSGSLDLDDLKIIVLMVFWSLGEEPDALVLDELFIDSEDRVVH